MSKNERTPRTNVVDVLSPIDVPDMRAFAALNEKRVPAYRAKCAHRRIDAAWNDFLSTPEKLLRPVHNIFASSSA